MKINRWHIRCTIITLKQRLAVNNYVSQAIFYRLDSWSDGIVPRWQTTSNNQSLACNYLHTCSPNNHQLLKWSHLMTACSVSWLNWAWLHQNQQKHHGYFAHYIRNGLWKHELSYNREHHVIDSDYPDRKVTWKPTFEFIAWWSYMIIVASMYQKSHENICQYW